MVTAEMQPMAPDRLRHLVGRWQQAEGFAEVVASLRAGHGATLDGVRGSASALVAAALADECPGVLAVVCPHQGDIDDFAEELKLFTDRVAEKFPAWESLPGERVIKDEIFGDRVRLLKLLNQPTPPRLVVTSIQSLLQPVPARERLSGQTRRLATGETLDVDEFLKWLVAHGFHNTPAVQLPGEFSPRGGLLDIFAPDWYDPIRVELFGDQIESLRRFEVSSQRSLEVMPAIEVTALGIRDEDRSHLGEYLPPVSWFLLVEPGELEE